MNLISKTILSIVLSSLIIGCQSNQIPEWYVQIPISNPEYLSAVGDGYNLQAAKKSALSNINGSLYTRIESDFKSTVTSSDINGDSTMNQETLELIRSMTTQMNFSGIEYINIANNNDRFYAQAQIKRSTVIQQLKSEIGNINQKAKALIDELSHQDKLQWWLANKNTACDTICDENTTSYENFIFVRKVILEALSPETAVDTFYVAKNKELVSEVKSGLLIHIQAVRDDKKISQSMEELFTKAGIKTTHKKSNAVTHTLKLNSKLNQSIAMGAYISTKFTYLQLTNVNNNVIGSNEIISTGNSLSNYPMSKTAAESHFATQVKERGLWHALGQ